MLRSVILKNKDGCHQAIPHLSPQDYTCDTKLLRICHGSITNRLKIVSRLEIRTVSNGAVF